jgi:hypothetical protein
MGNSIKYKRGRSLFNNGVYVMGSLLRIYEDTYGGPLEGETFAEKVVKCRSVVAPRVKPCVLHYRLYLSMDLFEDENMFESDRLSALRYVIKKNTIKDIKFARYACDILLLRVELFFQREGIITAMEYFLKYNLGYLLKEMRKHSDQSNTIVMNAWNVDPSLRDRLVCLINSSL